VSKNDRPLAELSLSLQASRATRTKSAAHRTSSSTFAATAAENSEYPERLAAILWGDAMVKAYAPENGDEIYRVSEVNRKFFSDALQHSRKATKSTNMSRCSPSWFPRWMRPSPRANRWSSSIIRNPLVREPVHLIQ
jgi:hypothetical protein